MSYYRTAFFVLLGVNALLLALWRTREASAITPWHAALVPLGLYLGVLSAVMIHNAAHMIMRPLWLNRLIGELCALHQLYGFAGWQIPHILHHQYPDEPGLDPHPPGDLTFRQFFFGMRRTLRECLGQAYFKVWKDWPGAERTWAAAKFYATYGMGLRLMFWMLLLGPTLFFTLFLPSYVANVLFFAHFNYYTHRPTADGGVAILNLDHNLYYNFINRVFFGVYYHSNHHRRASLFNPMRMEARPPELQRVRGLSGSPGEGLREGSEAASSVSRSNDARHPLEHGK
jgi:stearoyl-CoA desaturase (delta-9 desaturase)